MLPLSSVKIATIINFVFNIREFFAKFRKNNSLSSSLKFGVRPPYICKMLCKMYIGIISRNLNNRLIIALRLRKAKPNHVSKTIFRSCLTEDYTLLYNSSKVN